MANDRHVIQYMSPAELVGLMNATGVMVHDTITSDGKPVIHAALKVVNAETGEQLPGGLPFSVVMFKSPNEAGYSNIAIGTIVPASELNVRLPRDYFNFCNQRFRFCRVFPVDERSFVIQIDLVLKNATREYVKFAFGLWGALFSQMVFELMGRGRESLVAAAEAYAQAHADFAQQIAATPGVAIVEPTPEVAVAEPEVEPLPLEAEAILPPEAEAPKLEELPVEEASEATVEPVTEETPSDALVAEHAETEPVDDAVAVGPAAETLESELSIAAGPTAEALPLEEPAEDVAVEPQSEAPEADSIVLSPELAAEAAVEVQAKEPVPA
jgi:Uncharacterized conserved protein